MVCRKVPSSHAKDGSRFGILFASSGSLGEDSQALMHVSHLALSLSAQGEQPTGML